jgi:CheY-like chemotaxis protein
VQALASSGNGSGAPALEVEVSDTGRGIAPEHLELIFREFEQIPADPGENLKGTGLGLPLTRKLVELHGGHLRVESEPGRGSVFAFTMPCAVDSPPSVELAPGTGLTEAADRADALVLVVEDDPAARDLIAHYLEESGYRVATATSGEEALQQAIALKPDAITLDLVLPDRDGLLVLSQLKSDPETRRIPVVLVSVIGRSELGLSLGAHEWLVKPVPQEVLLRSLDRATRLAGTDDKRTILVVDDDPAAVEYVSQIVRQRGSDVLTAANGLDGVALALRHLPDAIILDLNMPIMNGFEAVRVLRENSRTRTTPILIVTAKDLTLDERQGLQHSVQAIVRKGWQEELLAELGTICHPPAPLATPAAQVSA